MVLETENDLFHEFSGEGILRALRNNFEESTPSYFVDLVGYHFLQDSAFKERIGRVGAPLFSGRPELIDGCSLPSLRVDCHE
jgi:hypothetical protein